MLFKRAFLACAIALLSCAAATQAAAFNPKPGDKVQASPTYLQNAWQDCKVVSLLPGDAYDLDCGGRRYVVSSKWVRPAGSGSVHKPAFRTWHPYRPSTRMVANAQRSFPKGAPAAGHYECWLDGSIGNFKLQVLSGSTYATQYTGHPAQAGSFRNNGGHLSFVSGPIVGNFGQMLSAGRIGLSSSSAQNQTYYATCDPKN